MPRFKKEDGVVQGNYAIIDRLEPERVITSGSKSLIDEVFECLSGNYREEGTMNKKDKIDSIENKLLDSILTALHKDELSLAHQRIYVLVHFGEVMASRSTTTI